jgi:hypothetical protein
MYNYSNPGCIIPPHNCCSKTHLSHFTKYSEVEQTTASLNSDWMCCTTTGLPLPGRPRITNITLDIYIYSKVMRSFKNGGNLRYSLPNICCCSFKSLWYGTKWFEFPLHMGLHDWIGRECSHSEKEVSEVLCVCPMTELVIYLYPYKKNVLWCLIHSLSFSLL